MKKSNYFLLPFFLGASLSAFGANVNVFDESGNAVTSGDTLNALADSLSGNTVELSGNITETATTKFLDIDENMEITIRSDSSSSTRTITGNIPRKQAVQNSIFQQTGNKKTITLNVENVSISNPNGYVVCGVNVAINGTNAVFTGSKNPSDGSLYNGEGGMIRTTTNFKANGNSDGASKAGTVTITGTNTFTNNSAAKGGAIYATTTTTFSGDGSVAIFRGNTMSGAADSAYTVAGPNDIFSGGAHGKGVTIKDAGTYIFDGGIRLAHSSGGKLAVNSGASVTFEGGAINLVKNTTIIRSATVRFENADGQNCLMRDITVAKDGVMLIAEGAQIVMGSSGQTTSLTATSEGSVLGIELCDAYLSDTGKAAIVGDASGTSNTLSATAITLSAADAYALDLVMKNTEMTSYKIFDATTVSAELTKENFVLSDDWKNWEIADYQDGVVTLSYIPEPSAFGLFVGLSALALAASRRRRKA